MSKSDGVVEAQIAKNPLSKRKSEKVINAPWVYESVSLDEPL